MSTLIGLFATTEDARRAVDLLVRDGGFKSDEIHVLGRGDVREPPYGKRAAAGLSSGVVVGAIAGGFLGAASTTVAPGVGPVVTGGIVLPVAIGVLTGASTGGTAGALLGATAAGDAGLYFIQEVRSGRSLVTVTSDHAGQARDLMTRAHGLEVAEVGSTETARRLAGPGRGRPGAASGYSRRLRRFVGRAGRPSVT